MEVNGKGLFSREIYDRLKIICLSSCVDLKVNFLNSLTINGGAEGYGMLLSPQCFDIACSPVLQFYAFCFRDGDVKRFAVL